MANPAELDPKEYVEVLKVLKQIDFLQGTPDDQLNGMLFTLQKTQFGPSKTILFQGEISNSFYIVRKGSVLITTKHKGNKIPLADLKAPAYFGEISLLTPTAATATVSSGPDGAELLILNHEAMGHITKKIPDIKQRIQQVIDTRLAQKKKAKEAEENDQEESASSS